jgi:hypothetical protein
MPLATPQNWRVAVVTPYRGEPAADLQQCANSVRRQGSQFTHFVVCEGAVPDAVPEEVRVLPLPHCEIRHGCTARGIGAVLAFQLGFDAVVFLDAGRFLDDTYRERLLANAASSPADVLVLSAALSEGDISACADSGLANSLVVVRTAAYLGVLWSQLPALPTQEHAASLLLLLARAAGAAIRDVRDLGASASQVSVGTSIDGRVLFERTGFRLLADK